MDPASFLCPEADRPVNDKEVAAEKSNRSVQLPGPLIDAFIDTAWKQSEVDEFMGWLTGVVRKRKGKENQVIVDGLFLPVQKGGMHAVEEVQGAPHPQAMLDHMASAGSFVVGWVHSHPTFDAFFSSIDQHTMWALQRELADAFGIVIDKEKKVRCMRLSEQGLHEVARCVNDGEFVEDRFPTHTHTLTHSRALGTTCFNMVFLNEFLTAILGDQP